MSLPSDGVGLGWRPQLAADLLSKRDAVDFVEVVAETCFVQSRLRREAQAIAAIWPVIPHGVKLSLGSADGIDEGRARQLGALTRQLNAPLVSEHASFTRAGEREIGHLTQLPRTDQAVRVLARNVARARRHLPDVPLLLENVAATLRWPEDELSEGRFYTEVIRATGCELLLDLGNLYANAVNDGLDPRVVLEDFPLDRVAMVHLAGGVVEAGFYYDTHAAPIVEGVFTLVDTLFRLRGPVPVLIERDANFPAFAELAGEVERVRALGRASAQDSATSQTHAGPRRTPQAQGDPSEDRDLAEAQHALAVALTALDPPERAMTTRYGAQALERSRGILRRKRVDDALPLVPRTAVGGETLRSIALKAIEYTPRAPRAAGIADACRIADAAIHHPSLHTAASVDRLVLRARFVGPDRRGIMRARRGPFVGRTRLSSGKACWAIKGLGVAAPIHLFEPRGRKTQ